MLAFAAAPRYRSPWDCSEDTLPVVSLESLLLEVEASGRPAHRQATIRKAMGLPLTNPALEGKLKAMEFWPEAARPLDFDIADLVYMLSKRERATVYGVLLGVPVKNIAKYLTFSTGYIHNLITTARQRLHILAVCFGAVGDGDPGAPITCDNIMTALGVAGNHSSYLICDALHLPWPKGTVSRRDFPAVWQRLHRWEDEPDTYVYDVHSYVTTETYQTYFCNRPAEGDRVAPGPDWLTEDQASDYLGLKPTQFHSKAFKKGGIRPHLIPYHKGAWFNRADLDTLRTPAMAAT